MPVKPPSPMMRTASGIHLRKSGRRMFCRFGKTAPWIEIDRSSDFYPSSGYGARGAEYKEIVVTKPGFTAFFYSTNAEDGEMMPGRRKAAHTIEEALSL